MDDVHSDAELHRAVVEPVPFRARAERRVAAGVEDEQVVVKRANLDAGSGVHLNLLHQLPTAPLAARQVWTASRRAPIAPTSSAGRSRSRGRSPSSRTEGV